MTSSRVPPWLTRGAVMQALARKKLKARGALTEQSGKNDQERWAKYRHDLIGFCERVLGMTPWRGVNGFPGQREVLEAIQDSVNRQLAGDESAPFIILVEAPHGVGKTYGIEAPVIAWFYRCFAPSVTQSTANSNKQVKDGLWKDVRTHVRNAAKRGRSVMPGLLPIAMRAEQSADHFAEGFTVSNGGNTGTERAQGQHNKYHLWIFDEAEGIPDFMFDAVKRQFTGGDVQLWLLIANPKTSSSTFQEMKLHPRALVFRMSLLGFPNVWNGTAEVPGGTKRATFNDWIEDQRNFGCEVVPEHDETRHTFALPWDVPRPAGGVHPAGTIFAPKRGFLYGALGVPPSGGGGDTFISAGRFDACRKRDVEGAPLAKVQLGIDCARYGDDAGVLYSLHGRTLRYEGAIQGAQELDAMTRTDRYVQEARAALARAHARGAREASVRVDGSGGYGAGIVDALRKDEGLRALFPDGYVVHEVQFGSHAGDRDAYRDLVTEMYALADEVLSVTHIADPGLLLKRDLTERRYRYVTVGDQDVKKLEEKKDFKKRTKGQSPDDGDAAVLALAPERLFDSEPARDPAAAAAAVATVPDFDDPAYLQGGSDDPWS